MSVINKRWLAVFFALGHTVLINPAYSTDRAITKSTESTVDNSLPSSGLDASLDPTTGELSIEGVGISGGNSEFTLSPDVIQSIENLSGISGAEAGTNSADLGTSSSDAIAICLSEPCLPGAEGTTAISLQKLAKILEEDLQNSLDNLAKLEENQNLADSQPRRFSRRRTICDCGNSFVRARAEVEEKAKQYQKIIDLADQLNPQNNKW